VSHQWNDAPPRKQFARVSSETKRFAPPGFLTNPSTPTGPISLIVRIALFFQKLAPQVHNRQREIRAPKSQILTRVRIPINNIYYPHTRSKHHPSWLPGNSLVTKCVTCICLSRHSAVERAFSVKGPHIAARRVRARWRAHRSRPLAAPSSRALAKGGEGGGGAPSRVICRVPAAFATSFFSTSAAFRGG
jgi:hypothetical protein